MILHDSFLFFNDFNWVNFISLGLSLSVKQGNGTRRFFKAPQHLEKKTDLSSNTGRWGINISLVLTDTVEAVGKMPAYIVLLYIDIGIDIDINNMPF